MIEYPPELSVVALKFPTKILAPSMGEPALSVMNPSIVPLGLMKTKALKTTVSRAVDKRTMASRDKTLNLFCESSHHL